MKHIFKKTLLIIFAFAAVLLMTGCNPNLSLNPKYSYSDFEMNLGEKIPTDIEEYVNFDDLTEDEASFVRENTEIIYDGKKLTKDSTATSQTGDHTVVINYCGNQYRSYKIKITDNEPPTFTKIKSVYTFVNLPIDDYMLDTIFEARDNSGSCKIKVKRSEVNYDKAGKYTMTATATDPSGNKSTASADVVVQEVKYGAKGTYVYVSIKKQTLTYFVDGKIKLQTPVVTGNAYGHATPTGTFRLRNKARNITLVGRESNGDKYESFVYYWMAFLGAEYGLHDATWRSTFGGNIYQGGGSHGCVNMPVNKAGELFGMIEIGTPVIVR